MAEINGELRKRYGEMIASISSPKKDGHNPHFKSTYESINSILDVIKPALTKHKFMLLQYLETHYVDYDSLSKIECKINLHTRIVDIESGTVIVEDVRPLPANPNSQQFGSAETYARRYSLRTIFNLAAEDDDGEIAVNGQQGGNYYGN